MRMPAQKDPLTLGQIANDEESVDKSTDREALFSGYKGKIDKDQIISNTRKLIMQCILCTLIGTSYVLLLVKDMPTKNDNLKLAVNNFLTIKMNNNSPRQ